MVFKMITWRKLGSFSWLVNSERMLDCTTYYSVKIKKVIRKRIL